MWCTPCDIYTYTYLYYVYIFISHEESIHDTWTEKFRAALPWKEAAHQLHMYEKWMKTNEITTGQHYKSWMKTNEIMTNETKCRAFPRWWEVHHLCLQQPRRDPHYRAHLLCSIVTRLKSAPNDSMWAFLSVCIQLWYTHTHLHTQCTCRIMSSHQTCPCEHFLYVYIQLWHTRTQTQYM